MSSHFPEQCVRTKQRDHITNKQLFVALCASQRIRRQEGLLPERLHGDGSGPVACMVRGKVKQTTCTEGGFRQIILALCIGGLGLGEGSHTSFLLLHLEGTVGWGAFSHAQDFALSSWS